MNVINVFKIALFVLKIFVKNVPMEIYLKINASKSVLKIISLKIINVYNAQTVVKNVMKISVLNVKMDFF